MNHHHEQLHSKIYRIQDCHMTCRDDNHCWVVVEANYVQVMYVYINSATCVCACIYIQQYYVVLHVAVILFKQSQICKISYVFPVHLPNPQCHPLPSPPCLLCYCTPVFHISLPISCIFPVSHISVVSLCFPGLPRLPSSIISYHSSRGAPSFYTCNNIAITSPVAYSNMPQADKCIYMFMHMPMMYMYKVYKYTWCIHENMCAGTYIVRVYTCTYAHFISFFYD